MTLNMFNLVILRIYLTEIKIGRIYISFKWKYTSFVQVFCLLVLTILEFYRTVLFTLCILLQFQSKILSLFRYLVISKYLVIICWWHWNIWNVYSATIFLVALLSFLVMLQGILITFIFFFFVSLKKFQVVYQTPFQ